jgi:Ni/Co efflux regulator RcnB
MKKLIIAAILVLPLLMAQSAQAQTAQTKEKKAAQTTVKKTEKVKIEKAKLTKAEAVSDTKSKNQAKDAKPNNEGTKGKKPNSKIAIQEEGANVKKEKGVEDVE